MARTNNNAAIALANQLLQRKKPGDIPYILCRRNFPYELKSPQWDPMWEGLKKIQKGSQTTFVIDPAFNLKINEDGTCYIPDTENNRKKLDRVCRESVTKRKVKKFDSVTGQTYMTEEAVVNLPEYERLQENLVNDDLIKEVMARIAEMQAKDTEPEPEMEPEPRGFQESGIEPGARITPQPAQRGRPRKIPAI